MLIRKLAQGAVLWILGVFVFSAAGMASGYESFAFQNSYAASVPANVSYAGLPSDFVPGAMWDPVTGQATYSALATYSGENAWTTSVADGFDACMLAGNRFACNNLGGQANSASVTSPNPFVPDGPSPSPLNLAPPAPPSSIPEPAIIQKPFANLDLEGNPISPYSSPAYVDYESKTITFMGEWEKELDGTYLYVAPNINPGYFHCGWHIVTLSNVPEPSAFLLLAAGALAFGLARLRNCIRQS